MVTGKTKRRTTRGLFLALALAAIALMACGPPEPDVIRPAGPRPIRLVDELKRARIESPLLRIVPWEARDTEPREDVVWQPPAGPVVGFPQGRCAVLTSSRIECSDGEGRWGFAFFVPVEPNAFYRIRANVRSGHAGENNLRISDNRETRVTRGSERLDEWKSFSELWQTDETAQELRINFRGSRSVEIEALELRRVFLDPADEMAFFASQAKMPLAGIGLGMAKFGAFLPQDDPATVRQPFEESFSLRETLFAPAPTDVTYRLQVPSGARLRFSYGLAKLSHAGHRTRFEVLMRGEDETPRSLWAQEVTTDPADWHWHEATLDFKDLGGDRVVDLTLRTRSSGEPGYPLWGTPTVEIPRRPTGLPNVIVLAVDTLRADRLSGYGSAKGLSPNLDGLARDGVLFRNAVSQSTQTAPSFSSMFTGHIPARHRAFFPDSKLGPELPTLPRIFRQNGWITQAITYHAALCNPDLVARGFERFFCLPHQAPRADQNLDKALRWLDENADSSFFLFLHFSDPHQPFSQPEEFVHQSTADALAAYGAEIPFHVAGNTGVCKPCKEKGGVPRSFRPVVKDLYDEEVAYVDDRIGVFLRELKKRGLYDDSILVFVSDHGETLWDHHELFGHGGINQHDDLTRVPLIVKPAGDRGFSSGKTVSTQVRTFDLMPTLLELVGVDASSLPMEARSLVPLLRDAVPGDAEDRWAFSSNEQAASVRGRGFKYIAAPELGEELYDLTSDPREADEVAARFPEILRTMRARFMEMLMESLGGRFLLVLGDGRSSAYRVEVRVEGAWDRLDLGLHHLGLPLVESAAQAQVFAGEAAPGGLVLFVRLPVDAQGPPAVVVTPTDARIVLSGPIPFEDGLAERLLVSAVPGSYLLEAPLRSTAAAEISTTQMSAEQEKALRALGYIE